MITHPPDEKILEHVTSYEQPADAVESIKKAYEEANKDRSPARLGE